MTCGYKDPPELIAEARRRSAENGCHAFVLRIVTDAGVRYFSDWKVRLVTAWSIAGAKLFGLRDTYGIGTWEKRLTDKGYVVERVLVSADAHVEPSL